MTVKTGGAWAGTFVCKDATGALSTPSVGPAGVLYINGVANVAAVTITGSNPYKFAVTLPTLTAGQRVDMYITATISSIATAAIIASEQADTALVGEISPAGIWAYASRTLTQAAASVVASVTGSDIVCQRGDSLSVSLTDCGALTGYSKVYFTVKRDTADADTAAIIQIEKTAGLKYINGAAGTPANGTLTIDDEATGDITVALDEVETAKLDPGAYSYDVQVVRTAGSVSTLTAGTFEVAADVTRATA